MGKPVDLGKFNGKQNSGLVNFFPESRLAFVQITLIYRKMAAKARERCQK